MRLAKTVNIQIGRKLVGKSKDEIMKAVFDCFSLYGVIAVQIGYDVVRVSFTTSDGFRHAMENSSVTLFGLRCPILGGGPPLTSLHIFDYPYEEDDGDIARVCSDFGEVKNVKKQKYISDPNIFTGTRLVSVALSSSPPRSLTIGGYQCRVWYKGQPLVCNLCAVQGHKSADCPNKDKCRRCGVSGHFARHCTNAWGSAAGSANSSSGQASGRDDPAPGQASGGQSGPAPVPTSDGYTSLASITEANAASSRADAVDSSGGDPSADPSGGDPSVGLSKEDPPAVQASDSNQVSPADGYLFTCGQPMSEDVAPVVAEVSDSQCIAAEASVTAAAAAVVVCEDREVVEAVVDEGDASSLSQSILQSVKPATPDVSPGLVSSQSSPGLSSSSYGTRELKTKAKSVVGKLLQKNRSSPVSVSSRVGGQSLQRSGSHSKLPVVTSDRPLSSRPRARKT